MRIPDCGGPLFCSKCAMQYAQGYFEKGQMKWAETYREHAKDLLDAGDYRLYVEAEQVAKDSDKHDIPI